MAKSVFTVVRRDLEQASTAQDVHRIALLEFQTALLAGNWTAAEVARLKVIASMEAHMDHITAAYRAIKGE